MSDELQFTEEEIDHAVRAFTQETGYTTVAAAEIVRAVLRAVRAVPARCLNGSLPGHPATVGTFVQGQGTGGVLVRGVVEASYPVTTTVRTPNGRIDYLWTNTIRSWDPSTEPLRERAEVEMGMPVMITEDVPDGTVFTSSPRDHIVETQLVVGPPTTGKARIVISADHLRADDDGMAVEADR
jgi:hypothetical protein